VVEQDAKLFSTFCFITDGITTVGV